MHWAVSQCKLIGYFNADSLAHQLMTVALTDRWTGQSIGQQLADWLGISSSQCSQSISHSIGQLVSHALNAVHVQQPNPCMQLASPQKQRVLHVALFLRTAQFPMSTPSAAQQFAAYINRHHLKPGVLFVLQYA